MTIKKKYEFIKWVMESDEIEMTRKQRLKIAREFKRDIRKILKPMGKYNPFEENVYYSYNDTNLADGKYYTKEFFKFSFSEEEKEEFIKEQWRHINCPWDCTGKTFTQRIAICNFKAPNSFGAMSVVYHFLGIDC